MLINIQNQLVHVYVIIRLWNSTKKNEFQRILMGYQYENQSIFPSINSTMSLDTMMYMWIKSLTFIDSFQKEKFIYHKKVTSLLILSYKLNRIKVIQHFWANFTVVLLHLRKKKERKKKSFNSLKSQRSDECTVINHLATALDICSRMILNC